MTDERLVHLESRFAWLEHHALEQDKAVAELGEEVRKLRREIAAMRQQVRDAATSGESPEAEEPPPPHY